MNRKEKERIRDIEWRAKHRERPKKICMSIAHDLGATLIEKDGAIFIKKDGKEELLCRPYNPKQIWAEAFTAMEEMIPMGKSFLDYLK